MKLLNIALCLGLTATLPAEAPQVSKRAEKVQQEEDYSLHIPEGWQTGSSSNGLFYAVSPSSSPSDLFSDNFTVYAEDVPADVTLDQYFTQAVGGLEKMFPDATIRNRGDAKIDGVPAKFLHYVIPVGGRNFEFLQYCALKDGRAYILTGAADSEEFETYQPLFEKILNSFRFT